MARLSQSGARERLAQVGSAAQCDPRASFHSLSSDAVAALLSLADDDGYKVPRHANGSRARYYHARLIRAADQKGVLALDYSFSLYWNSELVAHGVATAPVAYDLATSHLRDNFAGRDHRSAMAVHGAMNLLGVIRDLKPLGAKSLDYSDETGAARATITRIR